MITRGLEDYLNSLEKRDISKVEEEDIIQFQKPPVSFLENPYSKDFIQPEAINLPF